MFYIVASYLDCIGYAIVAEYGSLIDAKNHLKTLRHETLIALTESRDRVCAGQYGEELPVQYLSQDNLCFSAEPWNSHDLGGDVHGVYNDGNMTTYYLVETLMQKNELEAFIDAELSFWTGYDSTTIHSYRVTDYIPAEGYEDGYYTPPPPKSSRLRRMSKITEMKFFKYEKNFIRFSDNEIRSIKRQARRATRQQNKKLVKDFMP